MLSLLLLRSLLKGSKSQCQHERDKVWKGYMYRSKMGRGSPAVLIHQSNSVPTSLRGRSRILEGWELGRGFRITMMHCKLCKHV